MSRLTLFLGLLLLLAALAHAETVTLTWDAAVPAAGQLAPEGYVVYRHDASTPTFREIGRGPATTLTFNDVAAPGQTLTYMVRAFAGLQLSAPSNEVTVGLSGLPGAPRNLTVTVTVTVTVEGPYPLYTGPVAATADSQDVGYEAALAVDGQDRTFWDTAWRTSAPPLPHTLTLDFGAPLWVDGLRYLPRQDGNLNGTITAFRLDASADGTTWRVLMSGTWTGDSSPKTVRFPATLARQVRLTATASWNGLPYASAAEVGVYGLPP